MAISESTVIRHPDHVLNNVCELCILAMDAVDALLSTGLSSHKILEELTRICMFNNLLRPLKTDDETGPYQSAFMERVCVGFIWLYGPYALPIIAMEANPQRVCEALNVCRSASFLPK